MEQDQQDIWILSKERGKILLCGSLLEVVNKYRHLVPNPSLAPTPSEIRHQGYWLAGEIRVRLHPDYMQGARGQA